MNVGDIVYYESLGLEKPLLIVKLREERSRSCEIWATVLVLPTNDMWDFCLCNLRTWKQMQGW
jgi:hypothetical protein